MDKERRSFLWGNRSEIRPPWALELEQFLETCTRCHDCITVCPTNIITPDSFKYPLLDFSKGECTFCRKCLAACKPQALVDADKPWNHIAEIKDRCLALKGILCRLCGDECEARAITFPPQLASFGPPVVSPANCTGCGACVRQCPTKAIFLR